MALIRKRQYAQVGRGVLSRTRVITRPETNYPMNRETKIHMTQTGFFMEGVITIHGKKGFEIAITPVRSASSQGIYFGQSLGTMQMRWKVLSGNSSLTSKEWAITALVSRGSTDAKIAASFQASPPAIRDCLRGILQKTGCWNRTEIALWYLKMGVERERRFSDRRVANSNSTDERRAGRRLTPERSRRANELHDINLDE
jgi:DNA-binding CsgD family transcriptional regulator